MRTLLIVLVLATAAIAQTKSADPPKPSPATALEILKPDTVIPDSYLVKFRNLQFEQQKVLARLDSMKIQVRDLEIQARDIELKEQEPKRESDAIVQKIQELAYQLATEKHLDPNKWVLDLDTLTWQPKKEKKQ